MQHKTSEMTCPRGTNGIIRTEPGSLDLLAGELTLVPGTAGSLLTMLGLCSVL